MNFMIILATALTLAQADTTFEQRWQPLTPLQRAQEPERQKTEVAVREPEIRSHKKRHHRRHASSGCRYGHKVYTSKRSWRCRR